MSIRKRNEFLNGDESEEELDNGYDSEAEEGRGAIANKRRKIDRDADSESEVSFGALDDAEDEQPATIATKSKDSRFDSSKFGDLDEDEAEIQPEEESDAERSEHDRPHKPSKSEKSKALKQVEAAQKKARKSGVIYISRVPPFMKPHTLKHFLEPHASKGIGRVFLTPEDHESHTKRVKNGGNKKKSFTDGWVEFNSKREAKLAAETLNGNIIGGKKGNFYHDDLWNMKYLRGFKWDHLNEQIANENAEREARMKAEIWKTRKENKAFVEDLERGKMFETMENKKRAKREREGGKGVDVDMDEGKPRREFKQRKVRSANEKERVDKPFAEAAGVRSKIF